MVRTKASAACGARVSAEKAPRKSFGGGSSSVDLGSPSSKKDKFAGGNPVCKRPTPEWQKPISKFFIARSIEEENGEGHSPPKRRLASADEGKENMDPKISDSSPTKTNGNSSKEKPGTSATTSANGCVLSVNDEISEDD